jgi:hypothetical protein
VVVTSSPNCWGVLRPAVFSPRSKPKVAELPHACLLCGNFAVYYLAMCNSLPLCSHPPSLLTASRSRAIVGE